MSTIYWEEGLSLDKHVDAIRFYKFDFTKYLSSPVPDTITSVAIVDLVDLVGIVYSSDANSCIVSVSGGTVGTESSLTVQIDTTLGQRDFFAVTFNIRD